ncbi:hypothetical protein PWG71_17050 [Nocardiopsis sp. N85]|uniref:hypothetical protein n=1 Tax=Nocardiopsis sp. N85 TaxID=3029400 RepID=UPI00237FB97D|nr:hypothetical protein [Nocardiopsis sp. N85]MDE3723101.1 hypothetical protein [Nocardiopsis sp. N85]
MQKNEAILNLVEGYASYADATEVNVDANSPAPAASTSPICAASIASSKVCISVVSGASAATLTNGC